MHVKSFEMEMLVGLCMLNHLRSINKG